MEEIKSIEADVRAWSESKTSTMQALKSEHVSAMSKLDVDKDTLSRRKAALEDKLQCAGERLAQQREELKQIDDEIQELQGQQSKLPVVLGEVTNTLTQRRSTLENGRKQLAQLQTDNSDRLGVLARGYQLYHERLGLDVERFGDDCLRVIFTKIDPANPARKFAFAVFVDESDMYQLKECVPEVPASVDLLQRLNDTNDFSWFVQVMRKEFRELVQVSSLNF